MNGLRNKEGIRFDLPERVSMTKGSSSYCRLNSMKSSTVEELVARDEHPLANTEQSGLMRVGNWVFPSSSEFEVQ